MKKRRVHLRSKTRSSDHKLTREEMIALVDKIRRAEGTEEETDAAVELFDANCLHPRRNGLIFWLDGPEPTTEEIVDKELTPGPVIQLGPPKP
jgi:hypothetical protein